jgi:hypothetical protein
MIIYLSDVLAQTNDRALAIEAFAHYAFAINEGGGFGYFKANDAYLMAGVIGIPRLQYLNI